MKILFLTDNFPPEVNAPATRIIEHARVWIEKGAEVTILTCAPNYPQGKIYPGYKNRLWQKEIIDGIKVIRVWSFITANNGFVKRVIDHMSFAVMSFLVGLFQKVDVIVATSPQFFTTWSGWALAKLKRKPWVFELRDLWPESIRAVGAMKKSFVLDVLEKIELRLYKSSSAVIAVTNSFKKNLIHRKVDPEKIYVVTNGSNLNLFQGKSRDQKLADKLNLNNKFVVGYIGTHGMAHGLEFIVNSLQKLKDEKFHFLFIGSGAKKQSAMDLAQKLNLKNTTFLDPIPKEEIPKYLSITDISLVPLIKSDTFKTVIPSKIFEAAAMRKPILLGVEGESQEIINSYKAGLCFEPENEADFLMQLIKIRERYSEFQSGCQRLAEDHDRKKLANDMLEILSKICHKPSL